MENKIANILLRFTPQKLRISLTSNKIIFPLIFVNMYIKIINKKTTESELRKIAKDFYIDMIKGVVDIEQEILAVGGEYHIDANMVLIKNGSKQQNIWGFNWYFDKTQNERIEYVSLINIRPAQGNRAMEIQDPSLRDAMKTIILKYLL